MQLIFSERGKTGRLDLEAIEMAMRSAMHQAGAAALSELLKFDPPGPEQRQLPCACGHTAHYVGLRSKTVLSAVGEAECLRPYYLCDRCHRGQFPIDVELDVENIELSPGVRRMLAMVGQQAAFDQGRQQMELLAGLSVTTKAVERTAEAIGADIEIRQQRELEQALQLNLPIPLGPRIPILYVEMDGTGVPVVRKETERRAGKQDGQPAHTREAKIGCVFTQTTVNEEGYPVRDEDSTTYVGAIETAEEFGRRLYVSLAAGMEPHGEKGRPRRRRGMDMEPGRSAFPGGHTNRRSLSCPGTPGGGSRPTVSRRSTSPKALEDGEAKQTGPGADRKFSRFAARARTLPPRFSGDPADRSELFRSEQKADALSGIS